MTNPEAIQEAMISAWRTLAKDHEVMRRMAIAELQWLSLSDLEKLTGYEVKTIEKWRDRGWIRMFKPGDSREWRTTLQMWREDQSILIEAGLLDGRGNKPTIAERDRRISELRRKQLRAL